jgi:competence protein ComEA
MKKTLMAAALMLSATFAFNAFATPVNINTANAKTIAAALKDVGPAKAKAIVKYRETHGPFESVKDLDKVKGIGEKTIEENKKDIRLGDAK